MIFNFDGADSNKRCVRACVLGVNTCPHRRVVGVVRPRSGKELKRLTLLELVEYVNSAGGQKVRGRCGRAGVACCACCNHRAASRRSSRKPWCRTL